MTGSGGSFFGKKNQVSPQPSAPKTTGPPNHQRLIELLSASQKNLGKQFALAWHESRLGVDLLLTVVTENQKGRSNWSVGHNHNAVGEPDWTLLEEGETTRTVIWRMQASDVALIENMLFAQLDAMVSNRTAAAADPQDSAGAPASGPTQNAFKGGAGTASAPSAGSGKSSDSNLTGNLTDVDLPKVLQSISFGNLTGKLCAHCPEAQVEVYFIEGELVHAEKCDAFGANTAESGDHVLLDLFTWTEGAFQFQKGWKTSHHSITKKMDALVLEGATLANYRTVLNNAGLTNGSILKRNIDGISESEFERRAQSGMSSNLDIQKKIFIQLRSPISLEDLLLKVSLPKSVWIPVVANLLNTNIIAISKGAQTVGSTEESSPEDDRLFQGVEDMIKGAARSLIQPDSGMYSYPMFLLFTQLEFARQSVSGQSFSVAMLEFNVQAADLSSDGLRKVADCFNEVKKPYDLITFSVPNFFLILLPQTDLENAHSTLDQLIQKATAIMGPQLNLRGGLALAPDNGSDLFELLKSANRLRRMASSSAITLATSRSLGQATLAH